MDRLPIRMACAAYDRMGALATGAVQVESVALTLCPLGTPDCEIREIPLLAYLADREAGRVSDIAIPVFPRRSFCRGLICVNSGARISEPQHLAGKRVGVAPADPAFPWIIGLLRQEHAIDPARLLLVESDGDRLAASLAAGAIDAAFGRRLPVTDRIRPLLADHAARDRDSWRQTGIFPILTVLAMPESLHAQHPWLAESLFKACEEAKRWCIRQMRFSGALRYMLPWLLDEIDAMDDLFGADPWPYGIEANRRTLEMAAWLLQADGRIHRLIDLDSVFTPIVAWAE